MKKIIIGAAAAFLTGCAALLPLSSPHVGGVANPANRLQGHGFSIAAPTGNNWLIASLQPDVIALVTQGDYEDESYASQANVIELPPFKSEEDARKFVAVIAEEYKNSASERYKNLETDYQFYVNEIDKIFCIDFTIITGDHKAVKQTANTDPMILKVLGTACQHPQLKTIGVVFGYSQRFYAGHEDPQLAEKAESAKKLFRFEPLPVGEGR